MGRDLVNHEVRAHDGPDELASGAGCRGAKEAETGLPAGRQVFDGLAERLDRRDGRSAGQGVETGDRLRRLVDENGLGGGGAHIDAEAHGEVGLAGGLPVHIHFNGMQAGKSPPVEGVPLLRVSALVVRLRLKLRVEVLLLHLGGRKEIFICRELLLARFPAAITKAQRRADRPKDG